MPCHAPAQVGQSLSEVDFERGLWGTLIPPPLPLHARRRVCACACPSWNASTSNDSIFCIRRAREGSSRTPSTIPSHATRGRRRGPVSRGLTCQTWALVQSWWGPMICCRGGRKRRREPHQGPPRAGLSDRGWAGQLQVRGCVATSAPRHDYRRAQNWQDARARRRIRMPGACRTSSDSGSAASRSKRATLTRHPRDCAWQPEEGGQTPVPFPGPRPVAPAHARDEPRVCRVLAASFRPAAALALAWPVQPHSAY